MRDYVERTLENVDHSSNIRTGVQSGSDIIIIALATRKGLLRTISDEKGVRREQWQLRVSRRLTTITSSGRSDLANAEARPPLGWDLASSKGVVWTGNFRQRDQRKGVLFNSGNAFSNKLLRR